MDEEKIKKFVHQYKGPKEYTEDFLNMIKNVYENAIKDNKIET